MIKVVGDNTNHRRALARTKESAPIINITWQVKEKVPTVAAPGLDGRYPSGMLYYIDRHREQVSKLIEGMKS